MSEGTEKIEAKLAAYIDNALPPKEHAEIEKFLVANPSHRQVIEELRAVKGTVASLPRETAPVEIMDHLQSHLERGALLDNVEESADSMRINRWPQLGAVAAVLLLTGALGVLIYQVLPNGHMHNDQVAIAPPSVQQMPPLPSLTNEPDDARESGVSDALQPALIDGTAKRTVAERDASRMAEAQKDSAFADAVAVSPNAALSAAPQLPSDSPVAQALAGTIVVTTDDLPLTQNLIAGYLAQNNLAFEPVAAERKYKSSLPADAPGDAPATSADSDESRQVQAYLRQQQFPAESPQVPQRAEPPTAEAAQAVLLVRNLTPEQASAMNAALSHQRARQKSELTTPPAPATLPAADAATQTTQPAARAAEVLASAATTLPAAPGAPLNEASTAPTTSPAAAAGGDWLILVQAEAPTPSDATTQPTTSPATQPVE
ncbi:MAG TPA: hypothetical protein VGB55_07930 [Tepidisphaeraceae bacterium]|jgi:hypothetical protein